VGSIAVVHETLSLTPDEVVDFDDVAARVATMAVEVSAPEFGVTPQLTGAFGLLPAAVATPLALVLTELLQNALQHGFGPGPGAPDGHPAAMLDVTARRRAGKLTVMIADNGAGLPHGFDLTTSASLGLQIVRTLVASELGGNLEITGRPAGGTLVVIDLPVETDSPPHSP
jgi:two-component sensor histidine kinase